MRQPQMQDDRRQLQQGMGCLMLVLRALAATVEVFLHRSSTFGDRYLGVQSGLAVPLIYFYPVFWEGHDVRPLYAFLLAYLFMCGVVRMASVARRRRGELGEHSYYAGTPRLMRIVGRMREATVKGVVEPALVLSVGAAVGKFNAPFGGYLMIAAGALFFSAQAMQTAERRRVLDLHDAYMEQRRIAEQWRSVRRD
jgi:hypothetical protein